MIDQIDSKQFDTLQEENDLIRISNQLNCTYISFKELCKMYNISFPEGANFDGVLKNKEGELIPIEHTRHIGNEANIAFLKESMGIDQKTPKNPKDISLYQAIDKKIKKSEEYLKCLKHIEKYCQCSLDRILLIVRPHELSPFYSQMNFESDILLHKDLPLFDCSSFFNKVYYSSYFENESTKIWEWGHELIYEGK